MSSDYAKCLPGPQSPRALQMLISELSPQQQWWQETNLWSPEFAHSLVATGRLFLRSLGQGRSKGGLPGTCIGACPALQVSGSLQSTLQNDQESWGPGVGTGETSQTSHLRLFSLNQLLFLPSPPATLQDGCVSLERGRAALIFLIPLQLHSWSSALPQHHPEDAQTHLRFP